MVYDNTTFTPNLVKDYYQRSLQPSNFGPPSRPRKWSKLRRANAESQLRAIIDISPGRNRKNPEKMSKGWSTGKSTGKEFFAPVSQSNEAAYKIL